MDKTFRRLYLHEIAFNLTTTVLHKSKNYRGVKEKKHDFEMSMPSSGMCYTIMAHFIGVPIIKSYSSSLTTCDFTPLSKNHCYSIKLKAILYR